MTRSAEAIVALVTHARHVPAIERQRFAGRVRAGLGAGWVVLETCHRAEAYGAVTIGDEPLALAQVLPLGGRALERDAAVRHAIAVATGRDSVVLGEDQILHQLRQMLDAERAARTLDPVLERLFALALRAGRRARSWRQGPSRSLADVAIAVIEQRLRTMLGREVLVVGAGRMGRLAVGAALRAGASVSIANRTRAGATALATTTGARIEAFDPDEAVGRYAGVVVALGGPWPLGLGARRALVGGPGIVVDLSVPAAIPTAIASALGSRLVTADDLADADPSGVRPSDHALDRVDRLIDLATAEFVAWLAGRDGRDAANALVQRADRERQTALTELWRRLPDLDAEGRAAIEGMARHLAQRLLRDPLERLGADDDGRHERAVRELWTL